MPKPTDDILKVDRFKQAVLRLCVEYGLSISHEDGQGGFEICELDPDLMEGFLAARDTTATGGKS